MRVVYDAGALIAAERRSPRMMDMHALFLDAGGRPMVPTIVLGQVWRSAERQVQLSRLLKGCRFDVLDVIAARAGGQLCGYAGTADLADAVVALLAIQYEAAIVTSDPKDLRRLTEIAGRRVEIFPI